MARWTRDALLDLARAYQPACVLSAAADLDVFEALAEGALGAPEVARRIGGDPRATTILLDALAALGLLAKEGGLYCVSPEVAPLVAGDGPASALRMIRHQGNCLRRWSRLAWTVRDGAPPAREPSVRGEAGDTASFVGAMDDLSRAVAPDLLGSLGDVRFRRLLDVGGALGTWTTAWLSRAPGARATLFDLPAVIPLARERLARAGLLDRVDLVPGDFYEDPLPAGADLVWLSAIAHQNDRAQNRALFGKIRDALVPGGRLLVRDVVMEESRARPVAGALFAVNMLVGTPRGGTFTFGELSEDLAAAGLADVALLRRDEGMHSVVSARRPARG
jgi:SAM-dependent methyltransferase